LKIEASHIRAMPVPQPSEEIIAKLYPLGKKLSKSKLEMADEIIQEIDKVILAYCFDNIDPNQTQALLVEFNAKKEAERKR
jgi:allophanate hydrolase subunit 1